LYLYCDGAMKTLRTDAKQVETLLKKEKITLSKEDFISKPLNYYVMDSDLIQVKRVRYLEYIVDEPISFTSISQTNPLVANGIKAIWQPGEKGILRYQIRERFEDGILKEKKVLSKTRIKEPTIEIIALGSGFFSGKYKKKFRMCASSYNPTVEQCDGDPFTTATGIRVRYGVVAVDPSVIKLGSKLWVSGYGYAIAADTGGLIKKMKIDLFFWKRLPNENWKGGFIDVYLLE
jgi:3D (Asp-Asp-Asp) domain-containing protein